MNIEQILNSSVDKFKQNIVDFCKNDNQEDFSFTKAIEFISFLKGELQIIGQQTIQTYFESKDVEQASIEMGNKKYIFKYKGEKEILTVLGKVRFNRSVYQQSRGGKSVSPLDVKLGVNKEFATPDVKEIVLYSCAHNTPEETSNIIRKCSLFEIHPTTIKRIISHTGTVLEANKDEITDLVHRSAEHKNQEGEVVVCSLDGVNVLLNEAGTRKGRPKERPDKEAPTPVSAYKNAMCGSVTFYKIEKGQENTYPERITSRYVSRMPEERYQTFKSDFETEIKSINYSGTKVKIMLTDAHKSIKGYLDDNPLYKDFERLIDFFHAAEHLSLLAENIFGKSSKEAQAWYSKYREILKHGNCGVDKMIRSAEYYIGESKLTKTRLGEAQKQLSFFRKNKQYMDYHRFLKNGWPIGSGVIEAACKSIVKQRMCRSGQRWTRKGGQTILTLRSHVKSNRWDTFWKSFTDINYRLCA
ncbi:MAG: hypothetical protein HC831_03505 [Chloroflexia bacterium]|nr:hypothetical protein [Chloroflexia bacterium]